MVFLVPFFAGFVSLGFRWSFENVGSMVFLFWVFWGVFLGSSDGGRFRTTAGERDAWRFLLGPASHGFV